MLGSFGLWASSKGMKPIADLVMMTRDAAKSQIVSDGFVVGTETAQSYTSSSDADKDNKVVAQNPTAGTLSEYESPVDITYGVFSFSAFGVFGFFSVFNFFSVFGFFSVFNFFSVFSFFSVFGFAFSVFSFFSVFGFSFSVFNFTPTFSVFGFR
jgi:hypothetical protein